jgi:hypothetical protein
VQAQRRLFRCGFAFTTKPRVLRALKVIEYRMNKWKVSFFATLTLLIFSNLFWLYSAIDAGVTYTYQRVSLDDLSDAHSFLGELVVKGGKEYSQKDILHLVRQSYPNAFIVEEGNKIVVNNVTFTFEGGKLSKVY